MKLAGAFAKKVIWAVDPFHENPNEQIRSAKAVNLLFKEHPVSIQPVSLLLLGRYNPTTGLFHEKWSDLAKTALGNLNKLLKQSKLTNLESPHLIKQEYAGVTHSVNRLLAYALDEKADMIVVSSHARKGAARLLLGSFAETLVLHSPLPVLVLNPKSQPTRKLTNILFPTDFSDTSREAYDRVLLLAKNLSCKVVLFHKLEVLPPEFGYPFVVPPVSKDSISELSRRFHDEGEAWANSGRRKGIEVKFFLATHAGYAVDDILKAAKRKGETTLIAMASQSGPVKSVLVGSLTRQVLRNATNPVLVIHPHQASLVTEAVKQLDKAISLYSPHPVLS